MQGVRTQSRPKPTKGKGKTIESIEAFLDDLDAMPELEGDTSEEVGKFTMAGNVGWGSIDPTELLDIQGPPEPTMSADVPSHQFVWRNISFERNELILRNAAPTWNIGWDDAPAIALRYWPDEPFTFRWEFAERMQEEAGDNVMVSIAINGDQYDGAAVSIDSLPIDEPIHVTFSCHVFAVRLKLTLHVFTAEEVEHDSPIPETGPRTPMAEHATLLVVSK